MMYPANQASHVPPPVPIYVYICEPCHNIHKITSSPVVELWTLDSQVPGSTSSGGRIFIVFASIFKNRREENRPTRRIADFFYGSRLLNEVKVNSKFDTNTEIAWW